MGGTPMAPGKGAMPLCTPQTVGSRNAPTNEAQPTQTRRSLHKRGAASYTHGVM
jgi:hypothetical protein